MRIQVFRLALVFALLRLTAAGNATYAQQFRSDSASIAQSVEREPSQVNQFFPLRVGTRWTYRVQGENATGSGKNFYMVPISGRYSETVVAVQSFGSLVQIVELRRDGVTPVSALCNSDAQQIAARLWYVVDRSNIFSRCSREEAAALASRLTGATPKQVDSGHPEFVLPLSVGASWGAESNSPKRDDTWYQWNVEDRQSIKVRAGKFQDCYKLAYRTLPDDEERWLCAGVGLVADEYAHHGTTHHYRIELQSWTDAEGIKHP